MGFYFKIILTFTIAIAFLCLPIYYFFARRDLLNNLVCDSQRNSLLIIFIIDVSDPYDDVDAERVVSEIRNILSASKKVARFATIYPNEDSVYSPIEGISGCIIPILAKSANFIMSEEERNNFRIKRESTLKKVSDEVGHILRKGPSRLSPLMETFIALSKRYDFRNSENVIIVIYSDMEQNSKSISVYRKSEQQIKDNPVPLERISLHNAQIVVKRIVRRTNLGLDKFMITRTMWDEWFSKAKAQVVWEK